ncbi:hypothetical protein LEL_09965 [Akanthomyces lecanii RCEF 1005]|uniref:DUF6604 domain-containing protein n=1 Tax=Akanthomyces lecanii RCEF 1005 TaxID=1081108 RepID=A0A162MTM9_CORDF|nr:hypothetical protein LEL_09965 [Akanthomyces lecanii RCEF 1005]
MPPSSLNGIYQQYKAGTDVVAHWLAVTAKDHVKGSEASQGGHFQADLLGRKHGTENHTYHQAKGFESMAVHIASCSGVAVPLNFSSSLDRVISVRKNFAERLASNGVDVSAESNMSHSFFVEVLEKVKQVLRPLLSTMQAHSVSTAIAAPAAVSGQPTGLFNNMFGALEVYQTSANFENQPDAVPPPPTQIQYLAEQDTSSMDLVFVVTALLDDYAQLRAAIRNLWSEHTGGCLDLAAVSVATNTAFELAHNMEDDVAPILEATGGMHVFITKYFQSLCKASGLDSMAKEHPQDPYNLGAYDIADVCSMNTLTLIHRDRTA